jgi:hypothetical protein
MASWCDKVEQGVNSVISKTWITLDSRFFGKNVIISSFKKSDDFRETVMISPYSDIQKYSANLASLSI